MERPTMPDDNSIPARTPSNGLMAFLEEVKAESLAARRRRLIFGLDATASRKPTWDLAASLQADMFREATAIGNLDLQLVFYRGDGECKATGWISSSARLGKIMSGIDCRAGITQIGKILTHAKKETTSLHVGAMTFVGDAIEENLAPLCSVARELGRLKTPAFMFQEGEDVEVETAFCEIARLSGGAFGRFEPGAAKRLGELLRAVAAFAAGGMKALVGRKDEVSLRLLEQMNR
jgi:hypothetical protein